MFGKKKKEAEPKIEEASIDVEAFEKWFLNESCLALALSMLPADTDRDLVEKMMRAFIDRGVDATVAVDILTDLLQIFKEHGGKDAT